MSNRDVLAEIVEYKRTEIQRTRELALAENWEVRAMECPRPVDFLQALKNAQRIGVIAEIKKASPSAGVIREDFDPPSLAESYAAGGADCLSVLTDEKYFQGALDYLRSVAKQVSLPVLRKDFILEPCQVYEAKLAGASAVLLIAECLTAEELSQLVQLTERLEMTALVELYDPANLPAVLDSNARLIGINNRNLRTFVTDLRHTTELLPEIPSDRMVVSESGIRRPEDVDLLVDAGVHAILVGEAFMRADDPGAELARLVRRGEAR